MLFILNITLYSLFQAFRSVKRGVQMVRRELNHTRIFIMTKVTQTLNSYQCLSKSCNYWLGETH